jgi:hypothetical protein
MKLFTVLVVIALLFTAASSETITWSEQVSVNATFTVASQDTLQIVAGTHIVFGEEGSIVLNNGAVFKVDGTESKPIIFSHTPDYTEETPVIVFKGGNLQNSIIRYAQFQKDQGFPSISINGVNATTKAEEALKIENSKFNGWSVIVTSASVSVSNSEFVSGEFNVFKLTAPGSLVFDHNSVSNAGAIHNGRFFELNCDQASNGQYTITHNVFDKLPTILRSSTCGRINFSHNTGQVTSDYAVDVANATCYNGEACVFDFKDNDIDGNVRVALQYKDSSQVQTTFERNTFRLSDERQIPLIDLVAGVGAFVNNTITTIHPVILFKLNVQQYLPFVVTGNVFDHQESGIHPNELTHIDGVASSLIFKGNTFKKTPRRVITVCHVTGVIDLRENNYESNNPDDILDEVVDFRAFPGCKGIALIFPVVYNGELVQYNDIDLRRGSLNGTITSDTKGPVVLVDVTIQPATVLNITQRVFVQGKLSIQGTAQKPVIWDNHDDIILDVTSSNITADYKWRSGSTINYLTLTQRNLLTVRSDLLFITNLKSNGPVESSSSLVLKNSTFHDSVDIIDREYESLRNTYLQYNEFISGEVTVTTTHVTNILKSNRWQQSKLTLTHDSHIQLEDNLFVDTDIAVVNSENATSAKTLNIKRNDFQSSYITFATLVTAKELNIENNKFSGVKSQQYAFILDSVVQSGIRISFYKNQFKNTLGAKFDFHAPDVLFALNITENRFESSPTFSAQSAVYLKYGATSDKLPKIKVRQNVFNNPNATKEFILRTTYTDSVALILNYWGFKELAQVQSRVDADGGNVTLVPYFLSDKVYDFSQKNVYGDLPDDSTGSSKRKTARIIVPIIVALAFILIVSTVAIIVVSMVVKKKQQHKEFNPLDEPLQDAYRD